MERHEDEQFYGDAKKHWETIAPTVDGMIKGPRRGRELHIKQILIQCTYIISKKQYNILCRTESEII
jgi:hypothetical protein